MNFFMIVETYCFQKDSIIYKVTNNVLFGQFYHSITNIIIENISVSLIGVTYYLKVVIITFYILKVIGKDKYFSTTIRFHYLAIVGLFIHLILYLLKICYLKHILYSFLLFNTEVIFGVINFFKYLRYKSYYIKITLLRTV